MHHIFFIHPSVDGHSGCFHAMAIANSAAVNIRIHVSFWTIYSRYMPRSWIAGSYGSSLFSFLRNLHTILHSGYINLHSHEQCRRVIFSPHPLQHVLSVVYLMMVILTDVRWYLIVFLTYISMMINNDEQLFMCLLAICRSYFEKCLFRSANFLIGFFGFCGCWVVWAVFIFWKWSLHQSHCLQIFSPSLWIVFSFSLWFPLLCKSI